MISLSNVSAQHMSLYGYERATTPNLDRWARGGIVFENAFTATSWTLPVATSLVTSLYPYTHRVMYRRYGNVLDERIMTFPELLRSKGYRTAALTGGLDYDRRFTHLRGFELVEGAKAKQGALFAEFESTLERGERWLNEHAGEKFLLFLHGYDAHCPFDPPEHVRGMFSSSAEATITVDPSRCLRGFQTSDDGSYIAQYFIDGMETVTLTQQDIEFLKDRYDEEIVAVDALVGRFLQQLDPVLLEKTVIIVFSDHGEMFARHGRFGRAGAERGTLYDDVVRIPLIMKIPGYPATTVGGLVQIIDVMPTLLGVLDLPQPPQLQGKNLLPLVTGAVSEINPYVFVGSEFGGFPGMRERGVYPVRTLNESVRTHEWKLIHEFRLEGTEEEQQETYELYHLKRDPGELRNVVREEPLVVARLKGVLETWRRQAKSMQVNNAPLNPSRPHSGTDGVDVVMEGAERSP